MSLVAPPRKRFASWFKMLIRASRVVCSVWVDRSRGMNAISSLAGTLLFITIAFHDHPVHAQLFNQAEQQSTSIFGQYLGNDIIPFMFGLLRIIVWVSAVGFILFAVYQAQRGEQWQPLMQNAFIVIAAVVVVEGLSSLFFGGTTGATPTVSPAPR